MSIFTSIINNVLQIGRANVDYMYHGANNVDRNADAALTITLSTVTSFLNQLFMAPLYAMIATKHILTCQVFYFRVDMQI